MGSGEGSRRTVAGPSAPTPSPGPQVSSASGSQVSSVAAAPAVSPVAAAPAAPSWRRVLVTTTGLWVARRLPRAATDWRPGRIRFRWPAWLLRRPSARGLRLPILVVALATAAMAVLRFTGTFSPAARSPVPGSPQSARAGYGAVGASVAAAGAGGAAAVRSQTASWIAAQVSGDETIACDPLMCAELHARGMPASRLLPLPSTAAGAPPGVGLIVASSPVRSQFGGRLSDDAPVLLASFGSGDNRIDVRAASPGGAAAYDSSLQADLAARRAAGVQLLRSGRIEVSAQAAGELEAGDVDTRVLVTLVMLASQQPLRVISFADAAPGGQVPLADMPFRQVTIANADSPGGGQAGLAAALALVRAQRAPYQPDQVTVLDPAVRQAELLIEFAAPGPLGLLTGGDHG